MKQYLQTQSTDITRVQQRDFPQLRRVTRYEIWTALSGVPPMEDSAEADSFRLLVRLRSSGGVTRHVSETDRVTEGFFVGMVGDLLAKAPAYSQ